MVTIILPGYSSHNKKWLEETTQKINVEGEIRPVYWSHWTDPESKFNPKEKAQLLNGVAGKRVVDIIAMSIGTLVASYLIQKSPEKIRKVVLCGIPLNDLNESDKEKIKSALGLIAPENIICFQNNDDPHGGDAQLEKFISGIGSKIRVISKIAEDHEYPYQSEFREFLLGWN